MKMRRATLLVVVMFLAFLGAGYWDGLMSLQAIKDAVFVVSLMVMVWSLMFWGYLWLDLD